MSNFLQGLRNSPKIQFLAKSILIWAAFMFSLVSSSFPGSFLPKSLQPYFLGFFGTVFAFLIVSLVLKLEGKKLSDIGLVWRGADTLSKFVKGVIIGIGAFLVLILAVSLFTSLELHVSDSVGIWSAVVLPSIALIPQALMEEIAFRSYPISSLQKPFGIRLTVVITAIAFALYHYIPGGNLIGSFLGPGIWGVVFALMAIWSKGIALPTGFHFSLNIMQAIFGMKEPYPSIWKLLPKNDGNNSPFQLDEVGLGFQLMILIVAVLLMERYIKKQRSLI